MMTVLTLLLYLVAFGNALGQDLNNATPEVYTNDDVFNQAGTVYFKKDSSLFSGTICEWHKNKQLKSQLVYTNGVLNGTQRDWYKNGQLESQFNFKNGNPHGKRLEWYENGQKWNRSNYKNGSMHGRHKGWHDNGILLYKEIFKNNELTRSKCYNREGKKIPCTP